MTMFLILYTICSEIRLKLSFKSILSPFFPSLFFFSVSISFSFLLSLNILFYTSFLFVLLLSPSPSLTLLYFFFLSLTLPTNVSIALGGVRSNEDDAISMNALHLKQLLSFAFDVRVTDKIHSQYKPIPACDIDYFFIDQYLCNQPGHHHRYHYHHQLHSFFFYLTINCSEKKSLKKN